MRSARFLAPFLAVAFLATTTACHDDPESQPAPDLDCNPVGASVDCFFPFPSDYYRVEDGNTHRVAFPEAALLHGKNTPIDFSPTRVLDGYPIHPPIFAAFDTAIQESSLNFHTADPALSLAPSATTLVLEASTGTPVAHFAELDHTVSAAERRLLQIRLYQALKPDTRYIVAVQNLKDIQGAPLKRPASFEPFVRGTTHASLKDVQEHYDTDIFKPLADFGVEKNNLLLAWDFTTRSDDSARRDLLEVMNQTNAWMDAQPNGPAVHITEVVQHGHGGAPAHPDLAFTLTGTFEAPLFLEENIPTSTLNRHANGTLAAATSTATFPLVILVPHSVVDSGSAPDAIIQYGHGFFGSTDELTNGFLPAFLNQNRMIATGTIWLGMSSQDMGPLATNLSKNISGTFKLTDQLHQAFANQSVLAAATRTSFHDVTDAGVDLNAQKHVFYGISLGHILGSTAVAVARDINQAVFSVGGGSFSFLMSRAKPFELLLSLLKPSIKADPFGPNKFFALSSIPLEPVDPLTWANDLLENNEYAPAVQRQVLAQVGIGDPSVPTLGSLMWARTAGIPYALPSSAIDVPLLASVTLPSTDSALTVADFNLTSDPIPGFYAEFSAAANDVHTDVRENPKLQLQVVDFILNNEIINHCDGACSFD